MPYQQLKASLENELNLVNQFIDVLQAEAHALASAEGDEALHASTAQKNHFADLLDSAGHERDAALRSMGYSADKQGLETASLEYPDIQNIFQQIMSRAGEASQLNGSNGVVIDSYLKHNQLTLEALKRLTGTGDLYNASGRTQNAKLKNKKGIAAG